MSISQRPDIAALRATSLGVAVQSVGIASVVKVTTGSYTVVTNQAFDTSSIIRLGVVGGAGGAGIQDTPNADGITHAITTFVGTVATDEAFTFEIERLIS
jgi:hypothetical protein